MLSAQPMDTARSHVALRQRLSGDVPFIFSSWLKSYCKAKERRLARVDRTARFDVRAYYESQDCTINRLLKRCEVLVACGPAEPSDLFGYVVFGRGEDSCVLHWVYVKQIFRRMGLARHLITAARADASQTFHSHTTEAWRSFERRLPSIHNPSLSR